jgi:DNA-binding NarL/FixJ family response regulator
MHIVELQRKLQEAQQARGLDHVVRGEAGRSSSSKHKIHMASVEQQQEIKELLAAGCDSTEIAELLNVPVRIVESEKSMFERYDEMRRKFLTTGILKLPESAAGLTIFQW